MNWPPLLVVFVWRGRNLTITIASAHNSALETEGAGASETTVSVLRARKKKRIICVAKARVMIDVSTLSENGLPQRHTVGTFDVCLARPKNCPAYIVRPHAAQLMIDRTVDHFCLFWPSAD